MSKGHVCRCVESKKPIRERLWEVWQYRCNHSVFNGSRRTPSEYSQLHCPVCNAFWRTKSDYVISVKLAEDERKENTDTDRKP